MIRLDDGDEVVGAVELRTGDEELCFVTSDAQLLHFGAGRSARRAAPAAASPASGSPPGSTVVFFGAFDARRLRGRGDRRPGPRTALPGTEPGAVKVTPFSEYPAKGRGTGGVRCHRFLKGEDTLVFAWAGRGPARAAAASGRRSTCPRPPAAATAPASRARQPVVAGRRDPSRTLPVTADRLAA